MSWITAERIRAGAAALGAAGLIAAFIAFVLTPGYTVRTSPVSGYSHWFDAADTGSIEESGGTVTLWRDKSGNNRHADYSEGHPTTGTRTINGLNTIAYDGQPDTLYESSTTETLPQPLTFFAVFKSDITSLVDNYSAVWAGYPGGSPRFAVSESPSENFLMFAGEDNVSLGPSDTDPHVVSILFNGASSQGWIDGVSAGSGNAGTDGFENSSFDIGTADFGGNCHGLIGELLLYPSALSTIDRQAVERYLRTKWGT